MHSPRHSLHLLRHAKAERVDAFDDKDRPLARRGREAAGRVGDALAKSLGKVDLVLCSTSLRTRETAELALARFDPRPQILHEDGIYLASTEALLRRLARLDESVGAVMVIGHNPGLHELAVALASPYSPHHRALANGTFTPGAWVGFAVAVRWSELDQARHEPLGYLTPKLLSDRG